MKTLLRFALAISLVPLVSVRAEAGSSSHLPGRLNHGVD